MNDIEKPDTRITPMSAQALEQVCAIEAAMRQLPQVEIPVHHALHGGMYARTVRIPAGVVIAGVFICVPTMLVVNGNVSVLINGESIDIDGYRVLVASAGRKQVFIAREDTDLTMLFATRAATVEEAENEFTDEPDSLASRASGYASTTIITGE